MKIAVSFGSQVLSNEDLVSVYPEWTPMKIFSKTGIVSRHIVAEDETAIDLAEMAAQELFTSYGINVNNVDFLILCTQSSEYRLPSSACLLQKRLGIPTTAGAFTFDHGCSGFIYGLSMAKGLITGGMRRMSCWLHPRHIPSTVRCE